MLLITGHHSEAINCTIVAKSTLCDEISKKHYVTHHGASLPALDRGLEAREWGPLLLCDEWWDIADMGPRRLERRAQRRGHYTLSLAYPSIANGSLTSGT